MESLETPIMHSTDTKPICSTLPCSDDKTDEISKNLEDELLYGANEDGDEDDAQSDDSLRLRLSDDDVDDDIGASLPTDQLKQPEKTEPPDVEFDVRTSNHYSIQHHENSKGMCSIAGELNDFKKELDLTDNHSLMENHFCNPGEGKVFNRRTNPFLRLRKVKYTYESQRKHPGLFKTRLYHANKSFPVNRSYSDHSYHSVVSNRYGSRYYNQNSHYGRSRGYKFGEFNSYFNIVGLKRSYSLKVYSPFRKVLTGKQHVTLGSNSQTNVSAIEHTSQKDDSPSGINDTQHKISNITKEELITTDNNSPQLTQSLDVSLDDSSLNSCEKISITLNKGEQKKDEDIDECSETITTYEIEESIVVEVNVEPDELEHGTAAEGANVSITAETEAPDTSENTTVTTVISIETSSKDPEEGEVKETESTVSKLVMTEVSADPPSDQTNNNDKESVQNTLDVVISSNDEPITVQGDDSEMGLNNGSDTVDPVNTDNLKTDSVTDLCKHNADVDSKENNKLGKKRTMEVAEDGDSVSKKMPCPDAIVSKLTSNRVVGSDEVSLSPLPPITETCSDPVIVTQNNSITNTLDNKTEKLKKINIKSESSTRTQPSPIEVLEVEDNLNKDDEKLEITAVIPPSEVSNKGKRRRRTRKINPPDDVVNSGQEKENVRQKRETAQKAEEMIRKRFLHSDTDSESSDNLQTFVNHNKSNPRARPSSPPSLKRICSEEPVGSIAVKKVKNESNTNISPKSNEKVNPSKNVRTLEQVRRFFWRDGKKSLSKFTQEELEELLIQKVIETITMRDEIGKLREQARISERNQEVTRLKCQQLTKQIKDFEMVLNRFAADRRSGDKNVPPIKINRSVGLQVNFVTDSGIQNLRQLQHNSKSTVTLVNGTNALPKQPNEPLNNNTTVRKGIKVRSPRRTSDVPPLSPSMTVASTQIQSPVTSTVTPAALVVSKPTDNRLIMSPTGQVVTPQGTITLNGALTTVRQPKVLNNRNSNSNSDNLIDLTGEEEKSKSNYTDAEPPPLAAISSTPAITPKAPPRYQRVIQPTPANVTINQPAFKIVQPVDNKPMPTAIVNNMNTSRFALVMQNIAGPRQLLMTTNANTIRPTVTTHSRTLIPGITYSGVQTISNGSVRVVPATTTVAAQKHKHPAPLPGVTSYPVNAALKLPPPAPSLKISKVANGIVLSWNMRNSDEYAEIASYQLYAYQEVSGVAPSTALWKKVGDVRALPLPMACTLTQFSEGNNYYFAVRGVDTHSRLGQYSQPGNISL